MEIFTVLMIALRTAALMTTLTATPQPRVLVWVGSHMEWATLGTGLSYSGGELKVVFPPATNRVYGTILAADASGYYPLPAGAKNIAVWLNGVRETQYTIADGKIVPSVAPGAPGWPPAAESILLLDYDP